MFGVLGGFQKKLMISVTSVTKFLYFSFLHRHKNGNLVKCCILLLGPILSPLSMEGNILNMMSGFYQCN